MFPRLLKKTLITLTGNLPAQRALEFGVLTAQYLMGIGPGASPDSSGERRVLEIVAHAHDRSDPLCVFDVGANKGQYLGVVLRTIGARPLLVHVFEPGATTFEALRAGAPADDRVVLNRCALGREPGEATLHYDAPGSGLASLSKRDLAHFGVPFEGTERVAVDTLDRYCAGRGVTFIDLLKLDVEGHELDVLGGAARMLSEGRIGAITFEFGGCNVDSRTFFRDIFQLLTHHRLGSISRITPSGLLVPIRKYEELHEQFRTTNFVAMPTAERRD